MAERKFLFMHADGYHEEQATTDTITLGGLTMGGAIAMGINKITGLGNGTDSTDAVNKSQLDAMAVGLSWKDPVQVLRVKSDADQSATPPTAGSAGEAWVVNNWGAPYNNGDIVEWDGSAWQVIVANSSGEPPDGTRVAVIESGAAGSFATKEENIAIYNASTDTWTFTVTENGDATLVIGDGGYYENKGYTFDGANWVQFTGLGLITAGDGLGKTGNTLFVNVGDGIAIDTDNVVVDLADTNPGLEFITGDLAAKVDTTKGLSISASGISVDLTTAGGLEFDLSGDIQIKIDDTPDILDVDTDGLKVVGLPSLFKVDGTAVGSTVTAANLDDLTDGSNATALHFHTGIKSPFVASEGIAKADPVYMTATADNIAKGDAAVDAKRWVIGLAEAAIISSETGNVVSSGIIEGALSGATAGTRYWLASGGGLTTTRPIGGNSVVIVGVAKNATDLIIKIHDYGKAG